jgi:mycofactocin precursor
MENDTCIDEPAVDAGAGGAQPIDEQLIEDELLVEEISIDGMCGVY